MQILNNKSWLVWLRYLALLMILIALIANLDLLGFTGANQEIKADIITNVTLKELISMDENGPVLGQEIENITLPNPYNETGSLPNLYIRYDFSFPADHVYANGDYFIFELPDFFTVNNDVTGVIEGEGAGFGTFTLTKADKQVRLDFDNIQEQAVTGYVAFGTSFEELSEEVVLETKIPIVINEKLVKTLKLSFAPKAPNLISKIGLSDRPFNSEYITWTIDFNKELKNISDPIIIDEIEENLELVPASIKLYKLNLQLNGEVSSAELVYGVGNNEQFINLLAESDLGLELGKIDGNKDFKLSFISTAESETPEIKEAYRLVFITNILDWNADEPADEYTNQATLSGTVNNDIYSNISAVVKVDVGRNKTLTKKIENYDPITQTITWQLEVNYNQKEVNPFTISDEFGANQQYVDGSLSIYQVTINGETGVATKSDDPYDISKYSFSSSETDPKGLSLTITNEAHKSSAYLIEYQTTAIERVLAGGSIINKASFNGKDNEVSQSIQQKVLVKDFSDVNYNSKTIKWTITVNQDQYWDSYTNEYKNFEMRDLILDDIFTNKGLSFSDGLEAERFELSLLDGGGSPAFQVYARTDGNDGFRIELAEPITGSLKISYTTNFDYEKRANLSFEYLENKVSATWKNEQDVEKTLPNVVKQFNPDSYTLGNGFKTGVYNAVDKKISWRIVVNYNLQTITGAKVTDYVYGNQVFDYGSIEVYNAQLNGSPDTAEPVGEALVITPVVIPKENDRHGFSIELGNISTAYIITYETDINDQVIAASYDNAALLTDEDEVIHANLEKTVAIPNGSKHVEKSYLQAGRILQWTVDINPTQSRLTNVEVTDKLSAGQLLLEDSIKLYSTTVDIGGNYKEDGLLTADTDYTITTNSGDNSFTLSFNESIERPYILKYDTFLMVADNSSVSNEVNLTATGVTLENSNVVQSFTVRITRGWGGAATSATGNLTVEKRSANDESLLQGAVFELWYVSGDVSIKIDGPLTTDNAGLITFSNLPYDRYELRELTAPTGYVKRENGEYEVDIDEAEEIKTIFNDKIVRAVRLSKLDDVSEAGIPGVHFRLHRPDGIQTDHYTDQNGVIALNDLPVGSYYFEEITPAVNYSSNETPLKDRSFIIDEEQIAEKAVVMYNSFASGPSIQLKKEVSTDNGSNWIDANSALGPEVPVGTNVLFRFTVTNSGNVPLTNITLTDQIEGTDEPLDLSSFLSAEPLQPQASLTYTLTDHLATVGQHENTATVTAKYGDENIGPVTDKAFYYGTDNSISLVKSVVKVTDGEGTEYADSKYQAVGDRIYYSVTVTNTGNVELSNVVLSDDLATLAGESTFAIGAIINRDYIYEVKQEDINRGYIDNTVSVTAEDPDKAEVSAIDEVTVEAQQEKNLNITKTASDASFSQTDQEISYTIVVTNNGNVTLTDVAVVDPLIGLNQTIASLAPEASQTFTGTYTTTQADLDRGFLTNTARTTAAGQGPQGTDLTNDASVSIDAVQTKAIKLVKRAVPTSYSSLDQVIWYYFEVENTGNVTLSNIRIDDPLLGISGVAVSPSVLAPGQKGVLVYPRAITQADLDRGSINNNATARGTAPDSSNVQSQSTAIATARNIDASVIIEKSANVTSFSAVGDQISYSFTIRNTGDVTLYNVTLDDVKLGISGLAVVDSLAPGQSETVSAPAYTVTQADIDEGKILNVAVVSAKDPDQNDIDDLDDVTINGPERVPSIALNKTADRQTYSSAGQVINYSFTVVNTGTVTLREVKIDDTKLGITDLAVNPSILAPGESGTASASYTVTAADIGSGKVIYNTAQVRGTPSGSDNVTAEDNNTVYYYIVITPAPPIVPSQPSPQPPSQPAPTTPSPGQQQPATSQPPATQSPPSAPALPTQPPAADDPSRGPESDDLTQRTRTVTETTPQDEAREGVVEMPAGSVARIGDFPSNGIATVDDDGNWVYTPRPGFSGEDRFTIIIRNADGSEEEVTLIINVEEPVTQPEGDGRDAGTTISTPRTAGMALASLYSLWLMLAASFVLRRGFGGKDRMAVKLRG